MECVGYSEIDKYAIQIYQKHFPKHENYGDIKKINETELPDFDILVGGFPCQSFSIAGKRKGFEDTRGTLFFDIARILRAKRPSYFLLENVKGLLSHDSGSTFKTIITTLTELGYDLQWQVLNSKSWVPQNRERIFIVGHLRGERRPEVFPFKEDGSGDDSQAEGEREASFCLSTRSKRYDASAQTYIAHALTTRPNLPSRTQRRSHENLIGTLRTHKDGNGFREMKEKVSPTIPARAREDGSGQPIVYTVDGIRRLTPVECERLQGFPDHWTAIGMTEPKEDCKLCQHPIKCIGHHKEISDSQRYKTLGNAVTTNVIQAIMEKIIL